MHWIDPNAWRLRDHSRWQVASSGALRRVKLDGSERGVCGAVLPNEKSSAPSGTIRETQETKKPCDLQGLDGAGWLVKLNLVTPTGMEQPDKNQGKKGTMENLPPQSPPSETINELLAIWAQLDEPARLDLLMVARSWVKVAP